MSQGLTRQEMQKEQKPTCQRQGKEQQEKKGLDQTWKRLVAVITEKKQENDNTLWA